MRTIKQFITDNLQRLSSQLSDLENNVVSETSSIRGSYVPRPVATARITLGGGVYTTGQAVRIDLTAGNYSVNLAAPADGQSGWLYVVQMTTGTVTLKPVGPMTINNASTLTHSSVGILGIYFDAPSSNFFA